MKRSLIWVGLFLAGLASGFGIGLLVSRPAAIDPASMVEITLSAEIDGADHFVFTREQVWNQHLRYAHPKDVRFNGQPWTDLTQPPPGWVELARDLDLRRAVVATRNGRDAIALETTEEGFDVYFTDASAGKAPYEVTVKIPRR